MNEITREEWARRLLEDQLLRLDELRNANPRDAGFKLWRQTTLTVIQRIWPTDLARSERFRRIAFTTPSSKATRTHLKECYERGCLEADGYLKSLILELETLGLEGGGAAATVDVKDPEAPKLDLSEMERPPLQDMDFGPSPFDREPAPEDEHTAPGLPGMIWGSGGKDAPKPEARKDPLPESHPSPPPAPPASAEAPRTPPPPPARPPLSVPRLDDRRALKEMLGFAEQRGAKPPATPTPPGEKGSPPAREPLEPIPPQDELELDEEALGEASPDEQQPARPLTKPVSEERAKDLAIQFLNTSPVLSATPKPPPSRRPLTPAEPTDAERKKAGPKPEPARPEPVRSEQARPPSAKPEPPKPEPLQPAMGKSEPSRAETRSAPPPTPARTSKWTPSVESAEFLEPEEPLEPSPTAAALTALAVEVAALGVPPKKRIETRAALLELARELDQRTATWESLRDVISIVLEHPALARRVVPLLVPYLDLE